MPCLTIILGMGKTTKIYTLEDYEDILVKMAYSTINSFANVLTSIELIEKNEIIDLKSRKFIKKFIGLSSYFITILLENKSPLGFNPLNDSQIIKLIEKALDIFVYPERYISKENEEHSFLTIAVLLERVRCLLEEITQGILNGDLNYYKRQEKDADLPYNLYYESEITKLSDQTLKDELISYYKAEIGLVIPEEQDDMEKYLGV